MIVISACTAAASVAAFTLVREQAAAAFASLGVRMVTLMVTRLKATARWLLLVGRILAALLVCVTARPMNLAVTFVFAVELTTAVFTAVFTLVVTAVTRSAFATIFGALVRGVILAVPIVFAVRFPSGRRS